MIWQKKRGRRKKGAEVFAWREGLAVFQGCDGRKHTGTEITEEDDATHLWGLCNTVFLISRDRRRGPAIGVRFLACSPHAEIPDSALFGFWNRLPDG